MIQPGEANRFNIDIRSDVAVFTSDPILKDLRLEGIPTLFLETKCDRESFDLFVALSIIPNEFKILLLNFRLVYSELPIVIKV